MGNGTASAMMELRACERQTENSWPGAHPDFSTFTGSSKSLVWGTCRMSQRLCWDRVYNVWYELCKVILNLLEGWLSSHYLYLFIKKILHLLDTMDTTHVSLNLNICLFSYFNRAPTTIDIWLHVLYFHFHFLFAMANCEGKKIAYLHQDF